MPAIPATTTPPHLDPRLLNFRNPDKTAFQWLDYLIEIKKTAEVLGLDPTDEMADEIAAHGGLESFLRYLIDECRENVVAIKPNLAYYDTPEKREILKRVCDYARRRRLMVILDVKRGDIADTQEAWAKSDLAPYRPDIVTLNGYMGIPDVVLPWFKQNPNLCVYVVAASSNKSGVKFQDARVNGIKVYQQMVLDAREVDPNRIGFVVGSTRPDAVEGVRAIEIEHGYGDNLSRILAPGLGKQGGDLTAAEKSGGRIVFPISSGLTKKQYLNGRTPKEASADWKKLINEALDRGTPPKSLKQLTFNEMMKCKFIKIAPDANEENWFKLNAGGVSPIYAAIKGIQSYPALKWQAAYLLANQIRLSGDLPDRIVPVMYGAAALGFAVADVLDIPPLVVRKEAKDHGEKDLFVGQYNKGERVCIVEDVATTGKEVLQTAALCREHGGLVVDTAAVLVNREGEAVNNLPDNGIRLLHAFTLYEIYQKQLEDENKIGKVDPMTPVVLEYLRTARKIR